MFKILYTGIVLHQDTTQDTTQDDSGVVNMDSILCCFANSTGSFEHFTKNLLDKSTTLGKGGVKVFESLQRAVTIN